MQFFVLAVTLVVLTGIGFFFGRSRALASVSGRAKNLHSLPDYYGWYLALWCGLPSFGLFLLWVLAEPYLIDLLVIDRMLPVLPGGGASSPDLILSLVHSLAAGHSVPGEVTPALQEAADHYNSLRQTSFAGLGGATASLAAAGLAWGLRRITPDMRARNRVEHALRWLLVASATIAVLTTIGIVLSLFFEAIRFFRLIPFWDFLFGLNWSPQTSIRADQVGSSGEFGAIPLFAGTLLVTFIAMVVAVPVGLMSAIYMADYASPGTRNVVKPVLEVLAGIPTVVYGFFAALTVGPFLRDVGMGMGMDVASESALAAGGVMGIMIIPFISSLSDDIIVAVPQSLRDGSLALGATRSETVRRVVLPAALPGVISACLLGVSRAIGETMIVVMAAGLAANLTANPLESVTTVTVQIVTLLVGDQEFDSAKTLAAFALGLVLFAVTLALNVIALRVVQKFREQYD